MKSALFIIFAFVVGLFPAQVFAAEPVERDAQCVATYINGIGVANGGVYPAYIGKGDKFKVDIKMKNTGTKPWLKSQNYKLGKAGSTAADADETQWKLNRVELPSDAPVLPGSEVIFSFEPTNQQTLPSKEPFKWQMLRERTANDPGGRFGQICNISLFVNQTPSLLETDAPSASTPPVSKPDIKTSTTCVDIQKDTQNVSASWAGYSASSVRVFLKDDANLVDSSTCLGSGTQSYAFPKTVPANTVYKVSVVPFRDSACGNLDLSAPTGGYLADVTNGGFMNPRNYTDPSVFHLKNMLIEIGNVRSKFNFENCAPTSYILPIPTGKTALHSFDVPISILLTRFAAGTNGIVQRNDINSKYPVIIRYRPVLSGSEGEIFKAPVPPTPNASVPETTQEVGEP